MTSTRTPEPEAREIAVFYEALPVGRENAITADQLARRLELHGVNADRQLRNLAQHSVDAGLLVCTGNSGYWRPSAAGEVDETIGRLESQAHLMLSRARALRRLVEREFPMEQLKLL